MRIHTDWDKEPPKLLWKKSIGPGWSSCTVIGTRLYTQYQLDQNEAIACYDTDTGDLLWTYLTAGRFDERLGSVGPRATPTFHDGKIYAVGAVGTFTCLDASTGKLLWSHDLREEAAAGLPEWGFASSPLVIQGIVIVYAGGPNHKTLLGYDVESGKLAWTAGTEEQRQSYCSPQPVQLGGTEQVLLATEKGMFSVTPATGQILWQHDWPTNNIVRVVQPGIVDESTVLLGTGFWFGTRKLNIRRDGDKWEANPDWTTKAIKPYFNDFVIHKGHAFGFDGGILTCVELARGKSQWRERGDGDGYGNGQVLLLADQDLLLVVSEQGQVCLVEANPTYHRELPGRFQAIEKKTWNHPVIAHGRLFVRNAAEIACFQLSGYVATFGKETAK